MGRIVRHFFIGLGNLLDISPRPRSRARQEFDICLQTIFDRSDTWHYQRDFELVSKDLQKALTRFEYGQKNSK